MHSYTSYRVRRREDRFYLGEQKGRWVVLSLLPIWEVCVKGGSVTKHQLTHDKRRACRAQQEKKGKEQGDT